MTAFTFKFECHEIWEAEDGKNPHSKLKINAEAAGWMFKKVCSTLIFSVHVTNRRPTVYAQRLCNGLLTTGVGSLSGIAHNYGGGYTCRFHSHIKLRIRRWKMLIVFIANRDSKCWLLKMHLCRFGVSGWKWWLLGKAGTITCESY